MNRAYPTAGVALCGNGSYVLMVYVHHSNRRELRYRESTDDGETWSSDKRLVYPSVGGVSHVTAAMSPSGNVGLFYAGTNHNLYAMRRIDGTWGAPGSWPQSSYIRNISGICGGLWNGLVRGDLRDNLQRVVQGVDGGVRRRNGERQGAMVRRHKHDESGLRLQGVLLASLPRKGRHLSPFLQRSLCGRRCLRAGVLDVHAPEQHILQGHVAGAVTLRRGPPRGHCHCG